MSDLQLNIPAKKWVRNTHPKRILAIRLQAMGDTVITLPYLLALRKSLPKDVQIDFLTREEVDAIPRNISLFDNVYSIGGKRNFYKQCVSAFFLLPRLLLRRYDVVIDLQNNPISKQMRKLLNPEAWCEFDKYSSLSAGERTRHTIEAVGLGNNYLSSDFEFKKSNFDEHAFLKQCGWDGHSRLVVLNPAAAFITRNWHIDNYVSFAKLWLNIYPETQFIVLGTKFIKDKAAYLKQQLGNKLIDMVDNNSPIEGFKIIQCIWFMLSEDSGLMHMSWISNKPTVAIFGSTRSDWVSPQNKNSLVFSSDDLPCGNCMSAECNRKDIYCLTRYSPQYIFEKVKTFIENIES